jgi:hypothetical protein
VPSYLNWRCPNCKSFLGRGSGFSPKQCQNCGIPLAGD